MKNRKKITREDIETNHKSMYINYRYNEISIGHSPHELRGSIIGPRIYHEPMYKVKDISNLIKKLKHK